MSVSSRSFESEMMLSCEMSFDKSKKTHKEHDGSYLNMKTMESCR